MKNNNDKIIDKAYFLSKNEFEDKEFTTSQLWKLVSKQEKSENNSGDEYVNFYVELLQDPRFIAIGSDKWKLRDYITVDEFDKLSNSKYSNVEYSNSEDKDDEKIIDDLIDEEIDEDIKDTSDDIENTSEEYDEEENLDNEIDEEDDEEEIEKDDEDDEE